MAKEYQTATISGPFEGAWNTFMEEGAKKTRFMDLLSQNPSVHPEYRRRAIEGIFMFHTINLPYHITDSKGAVIRGRGHDDYHNRYVDYDILAKSLSQEEIIFATGLAADSYGESLKMANSDPWAGDTKRAYQNALIGFLPYVEDGNTVEKIIDAFQFHEGRSRTGGILIDVYRRVGVSDDVKRMFAKRIHSLIQKGHPSWKKSLSYQEDPNWNLNYQKKEMLIEYRVTVGVLAGSKNLSADFFQEELRYVMRLSHKYPFDDVGMLISALEKDQITDPSLLKKLLQKCIGDPGWANDLGQGDFFLKRFPGNPELHKAIRKERARVARNKRQEARARGEDKIKHETKVQEIYSAMREPSSA